VALAVFYLLAFLVLLGAVLWLVNRRNAVMAVAPKS
jgi:hypothetical protein